MVTTGGMGSSDLDPLSSSSAVSLVLSAPRTRDERASKKEKETRMENRKSVGRTTLRGAERCSSANQVRDVVSRPPTNGGMIVGNLGAKTRRRTDA